MMALRREATAKATAGLSARAARLAEDDAVLVGGDEDGIATDNSRFLHFAAE